MVTRTITLKFFRFTIIFKSYLRKEMAKSKVKMINKDKPIHPYSRKAKQLRRELLKPEKVKKINPLKELLLRKFSIFKSFLQDTKSSSLKDSEIEKTLESYFSLHDSCSHNLKNDYKKSLLDSERKSYDEGFGIEIPKVTCPKLCKRLVEITNCDWSSVETMELVKFYKPSQV